MRLISTLCVAIAPALLGSTASAAVTVYNTQAAFLAALAPGHYLETFDSTPTEVTNAPIAYSNGGFGFTVDVVSSPSERLFPFRVPGGSLTDVFMSTNFGGETVRFNLNGGNIVAVGGFFTAANIAGNIIDADVTVDTDQTAPTVFVHGGETTAFLGYISDMPFTTLTVGFGGVSNSFATINDFVVGTAIPEPTSLAALGAASAALLARRRTK